MAKKQDSLSSKTVDQLMQELESLRSEYTDSRFSHATQGLANPMVLRDQRRNIARYMTELRGREVAAMTSEQVANRSKLRNRRKRGA